MVRDFTLGDFFDIWGVRFDGHCVGGACDGGGRTLSVFVNGQPFGVSPSRNAEPADEPPHRPAGDPS